MGSRLAAKTGLFVLVLFFPGCAHGPAADAPSLWRQYTRNPHAHPQLPDNSFAGVHYGEPATKPAPPAFNAKDFGARGDGLAEDGEAIQAALDLAGKNGGRVHLPAGRYRVSRRLVLGASGVALVGEGAGRTTIFFPRSLAQIDPRENGGGASAYSWSGGLLHLGPKEDFSGPRLRPEEENDWRQGERLTEVELGVKRGDLSIRVRDASRLTGRRWVFLSWDLTQDRRVLEEMAGQKVDWKRNGKNWERRRSLPWPVEISAVEGNTLRLRQPMRLSVGEGQVVWVRALDRSVSHVGLEGLRLEMGSGAARKHLAETGFNAVFLHRCLHCHVKDVEITGADNGVILNATKNASVRNVRLLGDRRFHHGFFSKHTHDALFSDFVLECPVTHGINADIFGSGNVWSRGRMEHGTFDFHRGMQFDLIRTDIDIHDDGQIGGNEDAGPEQGVRVVHWNIRLRGKSAAVAPRVLPSGALVGIQGASEPVACDAPCVVESAGEAPKPANLYEAELALRLGK